MVRPTTNAFAMRPHARAKRRSRRRWSLVALGTLAIPASGLASAPAAPDSTTSRPGSLAPLSSTTTAGAAQSADFLGFELDEERAYLLEPGGERGGAEAATWAIRLAHVEGSGADRTGRFVLRHSRRAPRARNRRPAPGAVTLAWVNATLEVNGHGAPLWVTYSITRDVYGLGEETFSITYRHDDDHYDKAVTVQGAQWGLGVEIINHDNLDPKIPVGLLAFSPRSVACMEWHTGTLVEQRTGTGRTGPTPLPGAAPAASVPSEAEASDFCAEVNVDAAFANPGLLSLGMPLLWERGGDAELVLFSPLRPDLVRGQNRGVPIRIVPIIGFNGDIRELSSECFFSFARTFTIGDGPDGDKDRARDPRRHFFPQRLTLSERRRIDVGRRKMMALPLEIGAFAGTVWVDDWGKVVRMDLPPSENGGPGGQIRIRHASEM